MPGQWGVADAVSVYVGALIETATQQVIAATQEVADAAAENAELGRRLGNLKETVENFRAIYEEAVQRRDEEAERGRQLHQDNAALWREIGALRGELAARDQALAEAVAECARLREQVVEATARALRYEYIAVPGYQSPWGLADERVKADWREQARPMLARQTGAAGILHYWDEVAGEYVRAVEGGGA